MYPPTGYDNGPHITPVNPHLCPSLLSLCNHPPTYTYLIQVPVSLLPPILFPKQKSLIFCKQNLIMFPNLYLSCVLGCGLEAFVGFKLEQLLIL